jgi:hypothetical protein
MGRKFVHIDDGDINVDHVEDRKPVDMIDDAVHARTVIHVSSRGVHLELNILDPTVSLMAAVGDVNMGIIHYLVRETQHVARNHRVGHIKKSILWPPFTTSIQETTMLPHSFLH